MVPAYYRYVAVVASHTSAFGCLLSNPPIDGYTTCSGIWLLFIGAGPLPALTCKDVCFTNKNKRGQ